MRVLLILSNIHIFNLNFDIYFSVSKHFLTSKITGKFEKCEKCNRKAATITCRACGLGENYYCCYDWDKKLHNAQYKKSHQRKVIKTVIGQLSDGGIINKQGRIIGNLENANSGIWFSDIDSPSSPTGYFENFKKSLNHFSSKQQEVQKQNMIPEVQESEYFEEDWDPTINVRDIVKPKELIGNLHQVNQKHERGNSVHVSHSRSSNINPQLFHTRSVEVTENDLKYMKKNTRVDSPQHENGISYNEIKQNKKASKGINARVDDKENCTVNNSYQQLINVEKQKWQAKLKRTKKILKAQITELRTEIARRDIKHQEQIKWVHILRSIYNVGLIHVLAT